MIISHEKPPVYEQCAKQFGVTWEKGVTITYGDTIHFCDKFQLIDHLAVHESTHIVQQMKMGKELWWEKYFADEVFRLHQEKEAYINQYMFIKKNYNRHYRRMLLDKLSNDMAMFYGNMCTKDEAEALLSLGKP